MKSLLKYLRGYIKESIIAPLFKMLEACFELFVPIVTARIIDVGIKHSDRSYIWAQCALLIALGLIGLVCALTAQYFAAKAGMGFGANLRKDLYRHINSLGYAELDRIGTPTLVTRLTSDVNQIQTGVNLFLRLFMRSPFLVAGSCVMAFLISPRVTVIFLIVLPFIALTIYLVMRYTVPQFKKVQTFLDQVVLHTRENYTGARVVRAFSRQEDEKKDFADANERLFDRQISAGRISALMNPVTYALANLGIIAILMVGGREVDAGHLTQGQIVALTNYMTQVLLSLLVLANLIVNVTKASASAIRVGEVFAVKPQMQEGTLGGIQSADGASQAGVKPRTAEDIPEAADAGGQEKMKVSFQNVSFRYEEGGEDVLRHISFTAASGETIGVIGGTGSGKTTLVNLIPRFYDATEGTVTVSGRPVSDYTYRALRTRIGIVPQRSVLFSGSIRENLRWRKPDASDTEIRAALACAQALEVVEQKQEGLDTHLTPGGGNLSGGQRQRLAIARALVGAPDILILDDSSSALDYATDAALRASIRAGSGERITFLVSQRVSTVRGADKILVLDDGELAGCGTHAALLKSCALYREICRSQLTEEEMAKALPEDTADKRTGEGEKQETKGGQRR